MNAKRLIPVVALLLLLAATVHAQNDAQFCVRAFEDRNANGERDPGEPLLTRGLGANLVDSSGVVIETALLDNSPTGAQGVICFEGLANQQFTLEITSADYLATTMDNMTVTITNDAQTRTTVFEYGGQRVEASPANQTSEEPPVDEEEVLQRVLISGAGALLAMLGSLIIGLILYLVFLRGRARRAGNLPPDDYYNPRATTTNTMRSVKTDTGEYPRQ